MKKNLIEWAVFALSLAMLIGVLAVLIGEATGEANGPAILLIETGEPTPRGEAIAVPFKVTNEGGDTAEGVQVEAKSGDQTSTVEIAYVPRKSERKGIFLFKPPMDTAAVEARVIGYEEP